MTKNDGTSKSKAELQQEVEAKRDQIANTVDEIRLTLTDEVRDKKRAVKQATDWRYHVKKHPVAYVGGAATVGIIAGALVGKKVFAEHHEPTLRERADELRHNAGDDMRKSTRKVDEWTHRAQGDSKWKARTKSAMSSGGDVLLRELSKTARRLILPTVLAAITGKLSGGGKKKTGC